MPTPSGISSTGSPRLWAPADKRPMAGLSLVGTFHADPGGYRRTCRILEILRPDVTAVEVSPFALAFRIRHRSFLLKRLQRSVATAAERLGMPRNQALGHPHIRRLFRQIAIPYEWRAAQAHRRAHGVPCYPVDSSRLSQRLLAHWPQLLSPANLTVLLTLPGDPDPSADHVYRQAAWTVQAGAVSAPPPSGAWPTIFWERERHLEVQIRAILTTLKPRHLVYLGGWEHLRIQEDPATVRRRLQDLQPRCLLLDGTVVDDGP